MTEEVQQHILTRGQKFYMGVKAAMDFVIALIMIIVLSPLFLVTAIAIKIDSKGPVFFCRSDTVKMVTHSLASNLEV